MGAMARSIRKATSALWFAARHPKSAIDTLNERAAGLPDLPAHRFGSAMHLLTGLDVSIAFERDGISWSSPPGADGIIHSVFAGGGYQTREIHAALEFARQRLPGRRWMIDVGANIGTTTVPFAVSGQHVLAIEPVPDAIRYLRQNVDVNGLQDRVRIVEAAVAAGRPEVHVAVSTSLGNSAVLETPSSVPNFDGHYGSAGTVVVQGMGLDEVLRASGVEPSDVALVWSDTQASESDVISTGSSLWSAGAPLWAEFWPHGLEMGAGLGAFIELADQHFSEFVASDDLLAGRQDRRPISQLRDLADAMHKPRGQSDVLLIP